MRQHFENIRYVHGNCSIRLPNGVFRMLSNSIRNKNGSTNSQQVAFSYAYLTAIGFLYKYANFVDMDNESYIQNSDIKELLGYSRTTKSIDHVIKKNGKLDSLSLTTTTKNFPIRFRINKEEQINKIPLREFEMVQELKEDDMLFDICKRVVKNRNYEIKEPLYMTTGDSENEYGTMYDVARTHEITIDEFMKFAFDEELDNIDFLIYGFIKSRCKGYEKNMRSLTLYKMILEIGIDRSTFYNRIRLLKSKEYISITHKNWKNKSEEHIEMESNDYYWLGV